MSGPTTRSNRPRNPVETPVRGRSRHGCGTCRIRRKKCDEQHAEAGLICGNCSRLQIECLGWGERRPEWSKDPVQLRAFKASIKAKIQRQSRASSDPIPTLAEPASPGLPDAPASAYPSSSKKSPRDTTLIPLPYLALPNSLVRPLSSSYMDPYNYRAFVEHVRILVNVADLPSICVQAFEDAACLGEWKHTALDAGCLSYRELAKRAVPIEKSLTNALEAQRLVSLSSVRPDSRRSIQDEKEEMLKFINFAEDDESRTSHASSDASTDPAALIPPLASEAPTRSADSEIKPIDLSLPAAPQAEGPASEPVPSVPYLAGLLFLHSIVSGLNQRVPEILSTMERINRILVTDEALETLPKMQRLLAAALVSCLSDSRLVSSLFSSIIATIDDNETACNSAITLALRDNPEAGYMD